MCASEEEHAHEAEVYFGHDRKRGQSSEDGEGNTPCDPDHHAHVGAVYLPTCLVKNCENCENSAPLCVYSVSVDGWEYDGSTPCFFLIYRL
jgi:hypothetical protein